MMQNPAQIIQAVRNAGIVGAGGGGFPTYVKLQAKVNTIIANGSECEPLLNSDRTMMCQYPNLLVAGMQAAMLATGAQEGIIALKAHYKDAIAAITQVLPADKSIKLHLLDNYYPAGDEFLLVYETTGKVIPESGIPLNVGVVVNNVITLMQIAQAINGKPITERTVTLAGEFNAPKVVTVPIGTTYRELIKLADGLKTALPFAPKNSIELIDGGPMMGKIVIDWDAGIAKTTSGILALPSEHTLITRAKKPMGQIIKQAKSACCQCFRCSDLCPRNLLGHSIYPHMTMRTIAYNQAEPKEHITSAFLCSQCGMCELVACDFMQLSPRRVYAAYKKELSAHRIKNPHKQKNLTAKTFLPDRKVTIQMLMQKIGLTKYNVPTPFYGLQKITQVRIPYNKHIGAKALPQVNIGQKVKMCDIIAASPQDALGSIYHATITGKITAINDAWIEITGQ